MEKNNQNIVYWTRLYYENWKMYIATTTEGLCYIGSQNAEFDEVAKWMKKRLPHHVLVENTGALQHYADEFIDYLKGQRTEFTLPMDLRGTPFQLSVWEALQEVPYGKTVTYTDIAVRIGKPSSVRAVGTAIGANPVLVIVPCHRVIAKSGKLSGFRAGVEMKEQLLILEK